MYRQALAVAASILALSGCTSVPPAQIASPERRAPVESNVQESKVIFVANVATKLIDKRIGQRKQGTLCVGGHDLIWGDNQGVIAAMQEQMAATLSKHGYAVHGGLIRATGERDADILVGVAIENIKANICYSVDGMKGDASLTLRWEVLDNKTKKSFLLSGSGVAGIPEFSKTGDPDVFMRAVEMATENILAQESFFKATRK